MKKLIGLMILVTASVAWGQEIPTNIPACEKALQLAKTGNMAKTDVSALFLTANMDCVSVPVEFPELKGRVGDYESRISQALDARTKVAKAKKVTK